jgi:myosin I
MAKVLYDFSGQKENELSIVAGEIVEIDQKATNGKYRCTVLSPHMSK